MDFTREPIIETIITPREGHKLVIRSSKNIGQEEYFVDAVELVAFGHVLFFRSLERPKPFLVPVSDYEVLEVREARMVLKTVGMDRSIKIGGGRETSFKVPREVEKGELPIEEPVMKEEGAVPVEAVTQAQTEVRVDKKRERRRHARKRKGHEEATKEEGAQPVLVPTEDEQKEAGVKLEPAIAPLAEAEVPSSASAVLSTWLKPPPRLISETMGLYRKDESFKKAFYLTEEEQYKPHDKVQDLLREDDDEVVSHLQEPMFVEKEMEGGEEPPTQFKEMLETGEQESGSEDHANNGDVFLKDSDYERFAFEWEQEQEPQTNHRDDNHSNNT